MEIKPYKLTSIIILLAIAFNITYYMDTHEGRLPWDTNYNSSKYNKVKSKNYYNNSYKKINYKRNNDVRYSKNSSNYSSNYVRVSSKNNSKGLIEYRKAFYDDVSREWRYWDKASLADSPRPVVIKFQITENGSRYISVNKSSGSMEFDAQALKFLSNNCSYIINKRLPNDCSHGVTFYITISKKQFGVSNLG